MALRTSDRIVLVIALVAGAAALVALGLPSSRTGEGVIRAEDLEAAVPVPVAAPPVTWEDVTASGGWPYSTYRSPSPGGWVVGRGGSVAYVPDAMHKWGVALEGGR
ncbi:MAG: hypothetical protein U0166_03100 [Acidobacteriota bacterium]